MPTFLVLHNGSVVNTIQGANPPALAAAVEKAVKLAGPGGGSTFGTPGQRLGGSGVGGPSRTSTSRPIRWDLNSLYNAIYTFFGLYFVSLFTVSGTELRWGILLMPPSLTIPVRASNLVIYSWTRTKLLRSRSSIRIVRTSGESQTAALVARLETGQHSVRWLISGRRWLMHMGGGRSELELMALQRSEDNASCLPSIFPSKLV